MSSAPYVLLSPPATPSQPAPVPPSDFKTQLVKSTFYFTYVFLLTTGTITFIEAIRTKSPLIRHVMNLETCISIVAAFFYSQFVDRLKEADAKGDPIPFESITITRYTDWVITTPLMLMVLCMVLASEKKATFHFSTFSVVILLNFFMIAAGYMGEAKKMDRSLACFIGFVFFVLLFGYIWITFMGAGRHTFGSIMSYLVFVVVWSVYGVVYLADDVTKNIAYNILDWIAKAIVGIFFWMYFTGAVVF